MGVSFRVSRTGSRYRHKPPKTGSLHVEDDEEQNDSVIQLSEKKQQKSDLNSYSLPKPSKETAEEKRIVQNLDNHISFTLSLFPSGYSIRKPVQNESGFHNSIDIPKFLHPYDRASETLFSAIECGQFPGDILDDIPCKFIDGEAFCEVQDYRECISENGIRVDVSPIITRVCLRLSLENIVKDIPAIADNDWTYGDLMEVESRILKALQSQLMLDPTPQLDRLSQTRTKLNLGLRNMRRKRLEQISEAPVSLDNRIQQSKRLCTDRLSDSTRLGDPGSLMQQSIHENFNMQNNVQTSVFPTRNNNVGPDGSLLTQPNQAKYSVEGGSPRMTKDQWSGTLLNAAVSSPGGQDVLNPFGDNGTAAFHGKRDYQDSQSSPLANKKPRLMQPDNLHGSDLQWKNTLMQQQPVTRGGQYPNNNIQKFSQQAFEGGLSQDGGSVPFTIGQEGVRYNLKEEPVETERQEKSDLSRHIGESGLPNIDSQQSRLLQKVPQPFMRSGFPQSPWNNIVQPLDSNLRKDDPLQKRKQVQSPRVSAGCLPQSPLSSKSGEFSSGSVGHQYGGVVNSGLVASQKDKFAVNPSVSESMQRQHQAQVVAAKRRTTSLPKTPAISGVGSPASVSNMNMPMNASSPQVGNQQLADQIIIDRFSKIEMVAMRFQLNLKKNKMEEYPSKPNTFSAQLLSGHLASNLNDENLNDDTCKMRLSKSMIGGNMNVCKTRQMNFFQTERVVQGNGYQFVPKSRTRMIMSEKPVDGTVAFHIGEVEDADFILAEDYLPVLPNTHMADLLAREFCSLMERAEYQCEDVLQPRPARMSPILISQLTAPPGVTTTDEMQQQFSEGISGQPSNSDNSAKPSTSGGNLQINQSHNFHSSNNPRMLQHPGNNNNAQVMQQGNMPVGVLSQSRPQQLEQHQQQQQNQQQQQQQQNSLMQAHLHPQQQQLQRSPMMNSMQQLNSMAQSANIHLGAHMANKTSPLQLQVLQQQQHHQQQQQRKMMGGLGASVGMGNMVNNNNNMVGLGNFGSAMGGIRGAAGISAPMSQQTLTNLSNAYRSGTMTPQQQAALVKMKYAQRSNMLGGPQTNLGNLTGARQVNPGGLSMLGAAMGRGNMNQMQAQRTAMGPPKGMNSNTVFLNPQQQMQLQQQQQQMQLQQQQQMQMQMQMQQHQQQQMQQESSTSPLQAVLSPPQMVGSPVQHHQQASPQQMGQRTPMSPQLSSGGGSIMNPTPQSPQLSSHTVGSIANSPMDLQGSVNNTNSGNNP